MLPKALSCRNYSRCCHKGFKGDLVTKTDTKSIPHNAPSAICHRSSAALASHAPSALSFWREWVGNRDMLETFFLNSFVTGTMYFLVESSAVWCKLLKSGQLFYQKCCVFLLNSHHRCSSWNTGWSFMYILKPNHKAWWFDISF